MAGRRPRASGQRVVRGARPGGRRRWRSGAGSRARGAGRPAERPTGPRAAGAAVNRTIQPLVGARFGDDWWRRGVIYQVYPRSFADSDGDGIGDLPGIIEHLDYLGPDGLGIDALWLSPIYPSPGHDLGYDVSDHEQRRPAVRDRGGFRPPRRGRPSARHPGRARPGHEPHERPASMVRGLARPARRPPRETGTCGATHRVTAPTGEPLPPNNWVSYFGGPGWQWDVDRGQFYYHTFLVEQPELDWRAPGVEDAQFGMIRGWLARGVDGFRLDVFNRFLKHPGLPSNPTQPGSTAWARQIHVNDGDQPDFPELIGRFRDIVDEQPRPDVDRRAVRRHGRASGRPDHRPPSRVRLGARRVGLDRGRDPGRHREAGGGLRAIRPGRRSSSRTTIGRASPRVSPTPSRRAIAMPWRGPRPCCC